MAQGVVAAVDVAHEVIGGVEGDGIEVVGAVAFHILGHGEVLAFVAEAVGVVVLRQVLPVCVGIEQVGLLFGALAGEGDVHGLETDGAGVAAQGGVEGAGAGLVERLGGDGGAGEGEAVAGQGPADAVAGGEGGGRLHFVGVLACGEHQGHVAHGHGGLFVFECLEDGELAGLEVEGVDGKALEGGSGGEVPGVEAGGAGIDGVGGAGVYHLAVVVDVLVGDGVAVGGGYATGDGLTVGHGEHAGVDDVAEHDAVGATCHDAGHFSGGADVALVDAVGDEQGAAGGTHQAGCCCGAGVGCGGKDGVGADGAVVLAVAHFGACLHVGGDAGGVDVAGGDGACVVAVEDLGARVGQAGHDAGGVVAGGGDGGVVAAVVDDAVADGHEGCHAVACLKVAAGVHDDVLDNALGAEDAQQADGLAGAGAELAGVVDGVAVELPVLDAVAASVEGGVEVVLLVGVVGHAVEVGDSGEVDVVGHGVVVAVECQAVIGDGLVEDLEVVGGLEQVGAFGGAFALELPGSDVEVVDAGECSAQGLVGEAGGEEFLAEDALELGLVALDFHAVGLLDVASVGVEGPGDVRVEAECDVAAYVGDALLAGECGGHGGECLHVGGQYALGHGIAPGGEVPYVGAEAFEGVAGCEEAGQAAAVFGLQAGGLHVGEGVGRGGVYAAGGRHVTVDGLCGAGHAGVAHLAGGDAVLDFGLDPLVDVEVADDAAGLLVLAGALDGHGGVAVGDGAGAVADDAAGGADGVLGYVGGLHAEGDAACDEGVVGGGAGDASLPGVAGVV